MSADDGSPLGLSPPMRAAAGCETSPQSTSQRAAHTSYVAHYA
jgi:hypothetical protein